jgi:hypothetical protein
VNRSEPSYLFYDRSTTLASLKMFQKSWLGSLGPRFDTVGNAISVDPFLTVDDDGNDVVCTTKRSIVAREIARENILLVVPVGYV